MADQDVRIKNLPDSGSPERVASELASRLWVAENGTGNYKRKEFLDLYAECLDATRGRRDYTTRPS